MATDLRQSENYAKYMRSLGWSVEKIGLDQIFIRHLPLFSLIKFQHPSHIEFSSIDSIAKKNHALFVKIEPFQTLNFPLDNWPLLPTKTIILDLKNISFPKDTRYEIRKASNLKVHESSDIQFFYKLLQETMKIGRWSVPIRREVTNLYQSFQPNNSVILISENSGCLLIWHGNTAHYMYAALTKEGRKNGSAYATLNAAIKFCQNKKLKYLDLEGIYDDRFPTQTKNWQGFTKFKLGWGGQVVSYPGSYTKYYHPLAKLLFSMFN